LSCYYSVPIFLSHVFTRVQGLNLNHSLRCGHDGSSSSIRMAGIRRQAEGSQTVRLTIARCSAYVAFRRRRSSLRHTLFTPASSVTGGGNSALLSSRESSRETRPENVLASDANGPSAGRAVRKTIFRRETSGNFSIEFLVRGGVLLSTPAYRPRYELFIFVSSFLRLVHPRHRRNLAVKLNRVE